MPENILFLGGAKRVSMARMFKQSAARRGFEAGIVSYEMTSDVPVAIEGEVVIGKRWSDADVVDDIRRVMRRNGCRTVVPFVDGAVAVASAVAEGQDDIFAPCSSAELSQQMFDKIVSASLFASLGLEIPETYTPGAAFPLIAKPRRGSASKGIVKIYNEAQLQALANAGDYLIQELVEHPVEYTVDCYVSVLTGEICAVVPRVRLEVEGGEVTRTMTVDNPGLENAARRALAALGLRGAVTLQYICPYDAPGRLMLMEINPRLGGGAVCSVHAGVDLPGMILDEARGIAATPTGYRPGTEIARYRSEAVFFK